MRHTYQVGLRYVRARGVVTRKLKLSFPMHGNREFFSLTLS
jgi:hypothetical protein